MRTLLSVVAAFTVFAGLAGSGEHRSDEAIEKIRADAAAVKPLVRSECVHEFLDATSALPAIEARVVYVQSSPRAALTEEEAGKLSEEGRKKLRKLEFDTARYYDTFYGSPLAYARALDLCAAAGLDSYAEKKIADYGHGTIGHLRLLASCGAVAVGVDVDPILKVLYGQEGDQGEIASAKAGGKGGRVKLVNGYWPGDADVKAGVGSGCDLFISKNTLKNGYVHPPEGANPRHALTLGVSDEVYAAALAEAVKPGGLVMIYNLGPAPAKEGEPFKGMADIRCPFSREVLEKAGFAIVEYDKDDTATIKQFAKALGWDQGQGAMDLEHDLFASYTLLRRK